MKQTASKHKIGNNNKDSTDDDDTMPGLQNRGHGDSCSNDDSDDNRGDDDLGTKANRSDKEYLLDESDHRQENPHQYFLTSTNSNPTIWFDKDNSDEYDGDNDDEDDDKPRIDTRYPIATLQLRGGNGPPQIETGIEEASEEVPAKDDIVIVEDFSENEEENDEPDNHNCSKQGIFGKYTNYGYTSDRTTTDEISTNTNDTVDTNEETQNQ